MPTLTNSLIWMSETVDRVMKVVAVAALIVMVASICLQVVARYGFQAPPAWTEEAARYAMVWVGLIGASISFKAGFDPKLVTISKSRPQAVRLVAAILRGSTVIIFLGPILYYCFLGPKMNPARSFLARNLKSIAETFDMPMIFVAIAVPTFIIAIFLHGLAKCAVAISPTSEPLEATAEAVQDNPR